MSSAQDNVPPRRVRPRPGDRRERHTSRSHAAAREPASPAEEQRVAQLLSRLDRCMLADAPRLRSGLLNLQRMAAQGRPISRSLGRTEAAVAESETRRAQREAAGPHVTYPAELPIVEHLDELRAAIEGNPVVIVAGETGSGKTTQLPKICLELGRGAAGMVGCTQPRRIAAVTVTNRVREELRDDAGRYVGYQIRFDRQCGEDTRIKFMTDGVLLAETRGDPGLLAYDTLIIDEAHERSLNIDFLLGYAKRLVPQRPDLKIVVSSATLDVERFSAFFESAPVVRVPGRTYPVDVIYREPEDEEANLPHTVAEAVRELESQGARGDLLVFLSGERDIRETADVLTRRGLTDSEIVPLLARLPAEQQRRAFRTGDRRRVILATNVAETSVTIPGIRYVVDAGVARISRYNHRTQVQRLHIEPISQASADQRKGRCGRIGPGVCVRLYSEKDLRKRPEYTDPEIRRTSLASVILTMLDLRLGDIETFPFLEPPAPAMVREGYRELWELGAIDPDRNLTQVGRKLARFPTEPHLGRMLLESARQGALREALVVVAALSVDDPRLRPIEAQDEADALHARFQTESSDFAAILRLWRWYEEARAAYRSRVRLRRHCRENFISYRRLREWQDVHDQLADVCRELNLPLNRSDAGEEKLHRSLLAGLLGRIGMKTEKGEYTAPHGSRFRIHPGSGLSARSPAWIMAAELVETTRLYARYVARIDPGWIEPLAEHLCKRTYGEPYWDAETGFVRALEDVHLYGLPIVTGRRRHYGPIDPQRSREIFVLHALVRGELQAPPPVLRRNLALLNEVRDLEARARRRDILVQEGALVRFYMERLPEKVCSVRSFKRWLDRAPRAETDALQLSRETILAGDSEQVTPEQFPDALVLDGLRLPLSYRYERAHEEDGITCKVPLEALSAMPAWQADWLVPGALPEKIEFLLRSLPKRYRRQLVPIPDTARTLLRMLIPHEKPLTHALAAAILRHTGLRVPPDAWPAELPPHLRLRFSVTDAQGREIDAARDLEELRARLRVQAGSQRPARQDSEWERDGIEHWDFSDLPGDVEVGGEGLKITWFPALVADGDRVGLRLFSSRLEAEQQHREGLHTLFRKHLQTALRGLRSLPPPDKIGAAFYVTIGGRVEDLRADIGDRSLRSLCLETRPLPRTAQAFGDRLDAARQGLYAEARDLLTRVNAVLRDAAELAAAAERLRNSAPPESGADLAQHLRLLVHPGFLRETPTPLLRQYPRYLKAIRIRQERLPNNPAKDAQRVAEIAPYLSRWLEHRDRPAAQGLDPDALMQYRRMLEEWRISLFAQELGTLFPVSAKRLDKQWAAVMQRE